MFQRGKRIGILAVLVLLIAQVGWAAAAKVTPPAQTQLRTQSVLQNIRYSQTPQILRVVFDVTSIPVFTTNLTENPDQLLVNFGDITNQMNASEWIFNDAVVSGLQMTTTEAGKQQAIINLKKQVS